MTEQTNTTPTPTRPQEAQWWQPALLIFFEISAWIGIPAVLALVIGNWIDTTYNTAPRGYYISVVVAFLVTIIGFIKITKSAKRVVEKMK